MPIAAGATRHDQSVTNAGCARSAASISPSSMRKPRILTWWSSRPRYSMLPSASRSGRGRRCDTAARRVAAERIRHEPLGGQLGAVRGSRAPTCTPPMYSSPGTPSRHRLQPRRRARTSACWRSAGRSARCALASPATVAPAGDVDRRLGRPVEVVQLSVRAVRESAARSSGGSASPLQITRRSDVHRRKRRRRRGTPAASTARSAAW